MPHSFFEYKDDKVRDEVIGLIADPYTMSDQWSRHQIYVKLEKDHLDTATFFTILRLKWRNVRKMIAENMHKLQHEANDNEVDILQQKHLHLKAFEMQIAKQLGNVTIV